MYKVEKTVTLFHCLRCNHEWPPRNVNKEPKVCPKCHSPYWKEPRKQDATAKGG